MRANAQAKWLLAGIPGSPRMISFGPSGVKLNVHMLRRAKDTRWGTWLWPKEVAATYRDYLLPPRFLLSRNRSSNVSRIPNSPTRYLPTSHPNRAKTPTTTACQTPSETRTIPIISPRINPTVFALSILLLAHRITRPSGVRFHRGRIGL